MDAAKLQNGLSEAKRIYDTDGFVAFAELLDASDVARLRQAFDEMVERGDYTPGIEDISKGNDAIFRHPVFEEYVKDERILHAVKALMPYPFELQHSKLSCKPLEDKGGGAFRFHQDFPFFPHTNYDLLALAIHLDDESEDSGPIAVVPGSHRWGCLSHCREGEFVYECSEELPSDCPEPVLLTGKAGNVTAHHSLTLHGSAPKKAAGPRRVLIFQYRAQDAVQLAGVIWKCTGYQVTEPENPRMCRFPDGTRVEIRGNQGRLFDLFGRYAPEDEATRVKRSVSGSAAEKSDQSKAA